MLKYASKYICENVLYYQYIFCPFFVYFFNYKYIFKIYIYLNVKKNILLIQEIHLLKSHLNKMFIYL